MDQTDTNTGVPETEEKALEGISVAPPIPTDEDSGDGEAGAARELPHVRPALDATDDEALQRDPTDTDAKLDIELDESFPGSDAPASTRPGGGEPAPSSGYDEAAERELAAKS